MPKVNYGFGGYLWYTKYKFEGVEEDSQADKKRENGRVYRKYRLYQSDLFRAIV